MILWFEDRFGTPGSYLRIWIRALVTAGIEPRSVHRVSLHKLMYPQQLLTTFMSRKAPTWKPELQLRITEIINEQVQQHKPQAVVLAAPESLACLGVHPEHATLHTLRGSVYKRMGIPFIVTLPISAWMSMVTQKDIGAANYGFDSKERMAEAQERAVQKPGNDRVGSGGTRAQASGRDAGKGTGAATRSGPLGSFALGKRIGTGNGSKPADASAGGGNSLSDAGDDSRLHVFEPASKRGGDLADLAAGMRAFADGLRLHPDGNGDGGPGRRESAGDSESDEVYDDSEIESGAGDSDGQPDGGDVSDDSESADEGGKVSSLDDDEEVDRFFYEPVLSPVGRFVITADMMKLKRRLMDGDRADGPSIPLTLNWTDR